METKQVIVMRKDLGMRMGKSCAQVAHASLAVFTRNLHENEHGKFIHISGVAEEWLDKSFTKICVYVNSEDELKEVYKKARRADMLCSIIQDSGKTEFNGVPTYTCCAIGPAISEEIDKITGELPLL